MGELFWTDGAHTLCHTLRTPRGFTRTVLDRLLRLHTAHTFTFSCYHLPTTPRLLITHSWRYLPRTPQRTTLPDGHLFGRSVDLRYASRQFWLTPPFTRTGSVATGIFAFATHATRYHTPPVDTTHSSLPVTIRDGYRMVERHQVTEPGHCR